MEPQPQLGVVLWVPATSVKPIIHKPMPIYGSLPEATMANIAGGSTSHIACWSDRTLQESPFTSDSAIRAESREIASMQINMEEKNVGGEEKSVPAEKLDNNETPLNNPIELVAVSTPLKENQPDKGSSHVINLDTTLAEETELIKDFMLESVIRSFSRSLNFDIGARDECSVGRENATAHQGKGVVFAETNVGLAYDLTTSVKQASNNYMSSPEDIQAPSKSPLGRSPPVAKTIEKPTTKRKYVRRKALNNKSAHPTIEKPTTKRKYVRRKALNKKSARPTQVTGKFTKEMVSECAKMCCRSSLSLDIEARDENSLGRENAAGHRSKENGVVAQKTNVALACALNSSMEQASNNNMPLPEEAQHQSKSRPHEEQPKEKPTRKRKYVREKALSYNSAPSIEVTGKLTKERILEYAKMCCGSSLRFDTGARDENSLGREIAAVHLSKGIGVHAIEKPTRTGKYVRKTALSNDSAPPTEVTGKLTTERILEYAKMCCGSSLRFDTGARDENSLGREIAAVHLSKGIGVHAIEKPTRTRKYVRKTALSNNSAPPTEVTGKLTKEMMPEYAKMCYGSSLSFDIGARDENSLGRENAAVHLSKEIGAVAIENPIRMRKYVREKALSSTSAPPAKVTGKLTTEIMPGYAKMCYRSSFGFDIEATDENSLGRENAAVHLSKEIGVTAMKMPTRTRKYVRRKPLNKNSAPLEEVSGKLTKEMKPTRTRKYVRRKALKKNPTPPAESDRKID